MPVHPTCVRGILSVYPNGAGDILSGCQYTHPVPGVFSQCIHMVPGAFSLDASIANLCQGHSLKASKWCRGGAFSQCIQMVPGAFSLDASISNLRQGYLSMV